MQQFSLFALFCLGLTFSLVMGCSSARETTQASQTDGTPLVARIAGESLTLDAFEDVYTRQAATSRADAADDSLAAYQDFLERYVNYRLKVLEGERAGYLDTESLQSEIASYRNSFAKPFLLDKEVLNPIILDLYEKQQEMIEASHILLRVDQDASPEDTLAAYTRMQALRDSVEMGIGFGDLAYRHSEDPSAQYEPGRQGARGYLGWFSAGRMVQAFEDMAYQTPVGETSPIFRTPFGYHLMYVHDRQEAVPDIRISHILIRPRGATAADSTAALQRADSLHQRILDGEDFAALATLYSHDTMSGQKGGDIGFVSYYNYQLVEPFRSEAFNLKEVNDVSGVVPTQFGYHLIKLTDRKAPQTLDERYDALKQLASRLPRTQQAETQLAEDIRRRYGTTVDTTALLSAFADVPDDSLFNATRNGGLVLRMGSMQDADALVPVITLGDSTYTLAQLVDFMRDNRIPRVEDRAEQFGQAADAFLNTAAITYEAAALEERDAEFGAIMQDFRNGLVLFQLMEDSVWTAASSDSMGLAAYFETHREAYRYPERIRAVQFFSTSDSLLKATSDRLRNDLALTDLVAEIERDSLAALTVDTVMVATTPTTQTQTAYNYVLSLSEGEVTPLIPSNNGRMVLVHAGIEPARLKTLEEARTEVVNDYQTVLEEQLIERLRRQYDVEVYPERLAQAFQGESDAGTGATSSLQ